MIVFLCLWFNQYDARTALGMPNLTKLFFV